IFLFFLNVCRQFSFFDLCCNCCDNHSWTKSVPYVILNNQNWSYSSLFCPNNWRKVGEINIAPFYDQDATLLSNRDSLNDCLLMLYIIFSSLINKIIHLHVLILCNPTHLMEEVFW